MTTNPQTCPKCGSPITPAMKFCETCGAKIETASVCSRCGAALVPGGKFCENCGLPAAPAAAPEKTVPPPAAAPPAPPVQEVKTPAEPPAPPAPVPPPVQEVKTPAEPPAPPAPVPPPVQEVKTPAEPPAPPAPVLPSVQVKEPVRTEKPAEIKKKTPAKKPIPKTGIILAGIVILAVLGAAVYFFVLPMTTGLPAPSQNQQVLPTAATTPVSYPVNTATPAAAVTTQAMTASLTTGPTEVPPSNRVIVIDTERDPITSEVTATFRGGEGQYGVSQIVVMLTRSDGIVETKSFKPATVGSGVTLQGTTRTDRIEVTVYFYTGEHYKIIDQIFEYKKRTG